MDFKALHGFILAMILKTLSTAQVSKKIFGTGKREVLRVLYNKGWKERLGAFQVGNDGSTLYWPKPETDAFVTMLKGET